MMNFTTKMLRGTKSVHLQQKQLGLARALTATRRPFSLVQNELEQHDFSDPLNAAELKLKNPT